MQALLHRKTESDWVRAWVFSLAANLILVLLVVWFHYQPGPIEHLSAIKVRFLGQQPQSAPRAISQPRPKPPEQERPKQQAVVKKALRASEEYSPKTEPAHTEAPVPLYKLNQMPRFVRRIEPVYPESERAAGREATIIAEVLIGTDGRVIEVSILQGDTGIFADAVKESLANSLFAPGYMEGRPVVVRLQIPFNFRLR